MEFACLGYRVSGTVWGGRELGFRVWGSRVSVLGFETLGLGFGA